MSSNNSNYPELKKESYGIFKYSKTVYHFREIIEALRFKIK